MPAIWREYLQFVREPRLPLAKQAFTGTAVGQVGQLLLLNLLLNGMFIAAFSLVKAIGFETPVSKLPHTPWLAVLAIVFAPLAEETVFRSWLDGRPRTLLIVTSLVALVVTMALVGLLAGGLRPLLAVVLIVAWLLWIGVELYRSRSARNDAFEGFRRHFPIAFWVSSVAFGLSHMTNFEGSLRPALVLMTIPQLMTGTVLGFARVRYGMWANIGMHATWNASLVLLDLAGV